MHVLAVPLFVQVAETIKTRIRNHEYRPGDTIPSAGELEAEFHVSNITIRRAMELLTKGGYVVSRRGMRAQVIESANEFMEIDISGDFRAWLDMAAGRKLGITAKVLDRQVMDGPGPIREILSLGPDEKVERIRRVRMLEKEPISYYVSYGPGRSLTRISTREIERRTFIETYQDACGIQLRSMEQKFQAIHADMDLAGMLGVAFGFPLFFVQNIYYADAPGEKKEKPVAVTHMYYRSDRYVYTIKRKL